MPPEVARGLERLASARSRLLEDAPQTRTEVVMRWLDEEVVPGRVVGVGRSSRRLVFVTRRRGDGLAGVREDGRSATLALERVGRVYETVYPLRRRSRSTRRSRTCAQGARRASLHEPRLRDARADDDEAVELINDLIDGLARGALSEAKALAPRPCGL